jgi:hypothetical protein
MFPGLSKVLGNSQAKPGRGRNPKAADPPKI